MVHHKRTPTPLLRLGMVCRVLWAKTPPTPPQSLRREQKNTITSHLVESQRSFPVLILYVYRELTEQASQTNICIRDICLGAWEIKFFRS